MDNDKINDLKQFISTTVSQETGSIKDDLRDDIKQLDEKLSGKIDNLAGSVADAIETSNQEAGKQLAPGV